MYNNFIKDAADNSVKFNNFGKKFLEKVIIAAGILTVGAIAEDIISYLKERGKAAKSKKYFEQMLEAHPQLQKVDPVTLARYWSSLYHFSPYLAEDPLAAGAYITQAINRTSNSELGGPPPDTFNILSDIQKKQKDTSGSDLKKNLIATTLTDLIREF